MSITTRSLGEISDEVDGTIRTGPFGSQLHESDYVDEGVPVIMPKNIVEGKVSASGIARIDEEDAERLFQHRLRRGDVVYGRRGDIGRRAYISDKEDGWLCGTGCLRISLEGSQLDPKFLYYYLGQPKVIDWIYNQAVGATMPNLNTSILRSIPIVYPDLQTQYRIAFILSAYDDLIENNTRRIQILEEMAQAIYREWFVNFRFPGHEKVRMVDSPLGKIPEGWDVKRLGDVIELAYGKALKKDQRTPGETPVYGSGGVVGYHNESLVNGPGIIVGRKGNVGSVYWTDHDFFPIDTVFYVQTNLSLHHVFYNLQNQNFLNNDAAVPGLNRNQAYSLPFLLSERSILVKFEKMVDPMFRQVKVLRGKNDNLRSTRDLMLPKLISGEVRVGDLLVK